MAPDIACFDGVKNLEYDRYDNETSASLFQRCKKNSSKAVGK